MTKKFPQWTPDKDQMLLCAAHVHRDSDTGFVQWKKVAEVIAQGIHSPMSCCGRHSHLIKIYSETEKALRASNTECSSPVSTPVPSPTKTQRTKTKIPQQPATRGPALELGGKPNEQAGKNTNKASHRGKSHKEHRDTEQNDHNPKSGSDKNTRKTSGKSKKRSQAEDDDVGHQEVSSSGPKKKKSRKKDQENKTTTQSDNTTTKLSTEVLAPAAQTPSIQQSGSEPVVPGSNIQQTNHQNDSSHLLTPQPPRQPKSWSMPGQSQQLHSSWNRPQDFRRNFRYNNRAPWMNKMLQDIKGEILDGLKRQMGV